jgi:capsular polysaccharide transport system permease protein
MNAEGPPQITDATLVRIFGGAPSRRFALLEWFRKWRWFALFVVLPTAIAAIYYGLIASDVYVSQSQFVIKNPNEKRATTSTLANLIQTTGLSGGEEQTNEVLAYIQSRDALKALDRSANIRAAYSSPHSDWLSRFPRPFTNGSFENLYKYYQKMVSADVDATSGAAQITTRAFTPQDAYKINSNLLALSEAMVNRLNTRAEAQGIAEAQNQVNLMAERALRARLALAQYRNSKDLLDPEKQAEGVLDIANTLIGQRAALQAQLQQMRRLTPRNPSIPALENRINAVSMEIAAQNGKVVGTRGAIASKLGDYQKLLAEEQFATDSLTAANAALVQARAEAQRQQYYLERVVEPNLPDTPLLPKRLLSILVVFVTALFVYFVGWMFVVGILEHAPEE